MTNLILPFLFDYTLKTVSYGSDSARIYVKLEKRERLSEEVVKNGFLLLQEMLAKQGKKWEFEEWWIREVLKRDQGGKYFYVANSDNPLYTFYIPLCTGKNPNPPSHPDTPIIPKKIDVNVGGKVDGKVKIEVDGKVTHKIDVPDTTFIIHRYDPDTAVVIHEIKLEKELEKKIEELIKNYIPSVPEVQAPVESERGFFRLDKDKSIGRYDFVFGFGHRNANGTALWLAPYFGINWHSINKPQENKPRISGNLEWTLLSGDESNEIKNLLNLGARVYNPWVSGGFALAMDSAKVTFYGEAGGALDLNPVVVSGYLGAGIDNNMKIKHYAKGALDYNSKHFGMELSGRSGYNPWGVYTNLGCFKLRFGDKVRLLIGATYETDKGMEFFNNNEPIGNASKGEISFESGIHWIFDNKTGLYLLGNINAAQDQEEKARIVEKNVKLGITYHFR